MIYGELKELKFYKGISENLDKAIECIESGAYKTMNGKHEIDGDNVFFNCQTVTTQPIEERFFEGHKKYIDIQIVIEGEERIGYSTRSNVVRTTPWNKETDFEKYEGSVDHVFELNGDTFIILFPEEPHMPLIHGENGPKEIKKVVFKIKA
ncbi:YhcH/YjgK/YiaL family protein [Fusobacterium sp.]|uniref:YhcH/YjgK/YiaL family protein n=1 Tax=Fusobacterium sp. TaxID=68766 RepID=UPI002604E222|nr:YhcH/YjgK/YiaL family protein [Fusobacterium sp.]